MFLKEAPINTAVLQDSHGDVKMFLDRKVKTVKKKKTKHPMQLPRLWIFGSDHKCWTQADPMLQSLVLENPWYPQIIHSYHAP